MAEQKAINALIQADTDLKPRVEQLVAIKGLGLLSVAVLIAETTCEALFERLVRRQSCIGCRRRFDPQRLTPRSINCPAPLTGNGLSAYDF